MLVFEVVTPGTWLHSDDRDWSWRTQNMLLSLESQFYEANLALNFFQAACSSLRRTRDRQTWERDSRRRSEIQREIEQERGQTFSHESWEQISFEAEARFKREQWGRGEAPSEFQHNLPFLYARAFLYAFDAFEKVLGVLAKDSKGPPRVAENHARMLELFPHLRGVRNTIQHIEDRSRGLGAGRNPQPLDLKPINNSMINAPAGGALVLNALNGTRYGSTMADGNYGEVDVSPESMRQLHEVLVSTLTAYDWKGPRKHGPRQ